MRQYICLDCWIIVRGESYTTSILNAFKKAAGDVETIMKGGVV
jgi:hypothetical protein